MAKNKWSKEEKWPMGEQIQVLNKKYCKEPPDTFVRRGRKVRNDSNEDEKCKKPLLMVVKVAISSSSPRPLYGMLLIYTHTGGTGL